MEYEDGFFIEYYIRQKSEYDALSHVKLGL